MTEHGTDEHGAVDLALDLTLDQLNAERAVYVARDNGERVTVTISRAQYEATGKRSAVLMVLGANRP